MSKIKNITQLRDFALETLEKLANKEIDCSEAGVSGKLCESVISTLKTQLTYSAMLDEKPDIPFMMTEVNGRILDMPSAQKSLPYSKSKK